MHCPHRHRDILLLTSGVLAIVVGLSGLLLRYFSPASVKDVQQSDFQNSEAYPGTLVPVENWNRIISIQSGDIFIAGLRSNGTVLVDVMPLVYRESGLENYYASLYDVSSWNGIRKISAGGYTLIGLRNDGTVLCVGNTSMAEAMCDWTDIVDISTSGLHTVGIKKDGTILSASPGVDPEQSEYPLQLDPSWHGVKSIKTYAFPPMGVATLAFGKDGTFLNTEQKYRDVYTDYWNTVALRNDGSTEVLSNEGSDFPYVTWTNLKQLTFRSPNETLIGLHENGTVSISGDESLGEELSTWSNIERILCLDNHCYEYPNLNHGWSYIVGIQKKGTVKVVGTYPIDVSGWSDIIDIVASQDHLVGLRRNGTTAVAICS